MRALADLVITLDLGALASWEFSDMKPFTNWVTIGETFILANDLKRVDNGNLSLINNLKYVDNSPLCS